VGGDAQDVHFAGGALDGEEHVEPVQGEGVEIKQVAGEDRVCLGPQKLRPGWTRSSTWGSTPAPFRIGQTVDAPIS
jgi:hypothetical protein